jgi:hypothetical protein
LAIFAVKALTPGELGYSIASASPPCTNVHEIFTVEAREAKGIHHRFNPPAGGASRTSSEFGKAGSKSATCRKKS